MMRITGRSLPHLLLIVVTVAAFSLDNTVLRVGAVAYAVAYSVLLGGAALGTSRQFASFAIAMSVAVTVGMMFNLVQIGSSLLYHATVAMVTVGTGFVLERVDRRRLLRAAQTALLAYQALLVLQIARGGMTIEGLVLPGSASSTNLVSAILIVLQLLHCVSYFRVFGRAPILLPAISLALAIPAKGRSGIILLAVLFTIGVVQLLLHRTTKRALIGSLVGAVVMAVLGVRYGAVMMDVIATTRLVHGFADESRTTMLSQYLGGLSSWEVFSGGTYRSSPAILTVIGNPHNSFVRAHYFFGLPYLLLLGSLVLLAFMSSLAKLRERWYLGALLAAYCVRGYFDTIAFPSLMDFVFFYLVFSCLAIARQSVRAPEHGIPLVALR